MPHAPASSLDRPVLSAVYGGGGPFGIAYGLAVAETLADAGIVLAGVPALGTSAGAWVASAVATGTRFDDLKDLPPVRVPNLRKGLLRAVAADMFGEQCNPTVRAVAMSVPTGPRTTLDGTGLPLADLCAASSAVPGLFAPHRIGSRLYVDGGVRSLVSVDIAVPADVLIVVAPLAGPMFGRAGWLLDRFLADETARWKAATGGRVYLIRPNHQIAALARHPLHLFDTDRARDAYALGVEQVRGLLVPVTGRLAGLLPARTPVPDQRPDDLSLRASTVRG